MSSSELPDEVSLEEVDRLRAHVDAGLDTDRDPELRNLKSRVVLDHMFQFTGLADLDGTLLEANQTALDAGGIERSTVIGHPVWEAHWFTVTSATQDRVRAAVDQAVDEDELVRFDLDVYAGAGGGATVTIDFSARPVHDSAGRVAFLVLEGRDIDEKKRAQRLKEQMFANVSHELRTPLTLILGRAEELLQQDLAEREAAAVRRILDNAQIMVGRINDLLQVAVLESEGVTPEREPVDVRQIVEWIASSFRPLADEGAIELRVEDGPRLPARTDPEHVRTILMNLVANACKATEDAGLVVLAARVEDDQLVLEVRDDGPGVPVEERARIFEPFHRVGGGATSSRGGTGLGLAIVSELVAAMGGDVEVGAAAEGGARFRVRLPHQPADPDELVDIDRVQAGRHDQHIESLVAQRRLDRGAGGPRTPEPGTGEDGDLVLLVEDNEDLLAFLVTQLQDRHRLVTARDGQEALQLLTAGVAPDLIVTDLMMPRLGGDELIARLDADDGLPNPPVLVLTARAGQEMRERLLASGASDYLAKPFAPRELGARIENLLEPVRLRRELERRNTLLQQYTSQVSHDLKTPLSSLVGFAETLLHSRARLDADQVEHMLDRIVANGRRLQRFVDDLLAEMRGSQDREPVPLDEVLHEVEQLLAQEIDELDVEIVGGDELPQVHASPGAIRSVLVNLLTNAINYRAADRRLRVELEARHLGPHWEVIVRDNGRGIPVGELQTVLERGHRGVGAPGEGTGLGLYGCRQLVARHGGELWVEAVEGVGTEVHFTLPASPS